MRDLEEFSNPLSELVKQHRKKSGLSQDDCTKAHKITRNRIYINKNMWLRHPVAWPRDPKHFLGCVIKSRNDGASLAKIFNHTLFTGMLIENDGKPAILAIR